MTTTPDPKRGEIWLVNLDPTLGAEIQKTRPAVVVSSDVLRRLPLRLVAPITGWHQGFSNSFAHLKLSPTTSNGLKKESAVDTLQLRGVDTQRFSKQIGTVSPVEMEHIAAMIATVVEYQ